MSGMRRQSTAVMFGALLIALPGTVHSQTTTRPSLATGQRVRITSLNRGIVQKTGDLLYSRGDSLGLRMNGSDMAGVLPWSLLERIDVSGGTRRHALHGLGIGFLAGSLIGVSARAQSDCAWGADVCSVEEVNKAAAAITGGVVMGLLGLGIGALIKTERWTSIPIGDRVGMIAIPHGNKLTLAGAIRF